MRSSHLPRLACGIWRAARTNLARASSVRASIVVPHQPQPSARRAQGLVVLAGLMTSLADLSQSQLARQLGHHLRLAAVFVSRRARRPLAQVLGQDFALPGMHHQGLQQRPRLPGGEVVRRSAVDDVEPELALALAELTWRRWSR